METNKAMEILAKLRQQAGLPEPTPLEKALAKKDEPIVEYVWGYIKQLTTNQYLAGRESEGGLCMTPDYREANYMKIQKGIPLETYLDYWFVEEVADPELGIDDFVFVEATISLKE